VPTIADYEKWKTQQASATAGAANFILGTIQENPDEIANNLKVADEFGRVTGKPIPPTSMVKEYRNDFQKVIEQKKNSTILSSSPRLSEWLRNPENAGIARDDIEGLSWWEGGLGASSRALSRGIRSIPQSYNQWMAQGAAQRATDSDRSFFEILDDENTVTAFDGSTYKSDIPGVDRQFFAAMRYLSSRLAPVVSGDQEEAAAAYQREAGKIAQQISQLPRSETGQRYFEEFAKLEPSGDIQTDLVNFMQTVANDPTGFTAFLTETAIESTPQIAAAAGVTVATRSPTAGAVFMGASSGAIEAGVAPVEFFAENGIDVSTPEGALAAISDPDLMRKAAERGQIRGLIIGALDGLSGGIAGQQLAKSAVGNLVLQSITQATLGAGGEAGAQFASGQEFNLAEVIVEGLAEFVTAPADVAAIGGSAYLRNRAKASDAQARIGLFQQLSGQAAQSKVRNRLPNKFREFVEQATKDGPVENVYIPADQFVEYFQGQDVDPFEVVDGLEGVTRDDLDAALAGGSDIQIPTATYAAHIAGSDHDAFLMENMRFDPDQMTAREAAEFNERAQEALQEAYEVAEQVRLEQEELRSFEQEIYDEMVSRLRAAGRSTDVATTEATLYPAFYRVMAERSGMTTEEFMQRYPLPKVEGALPEGVQARNVDELTRTLAEARAVRKIGADKRVGILEFISDYGGVLDPGGELKARDIETIKRGRGKKTLKLARGGIRSKMKDMFGGDEGRKYGFDDVAQVAIEAGYMADHPTVIEYKAAQAEGRPVPEIGRALLDAIDEEVAGRPQYSMLDQSPDENETLDRIEEYLAQIGSSLEDSDEAIRQAIEADQAGAIYGQDRFLFQFEGPRARGSIQFPATGIGKGDTVIRLFENANLSTMIHESGHYFLTVMQDLASIGEVQAAQDYAVIRDWWNGNAKDVAKDASKVTGTAVTEEDVRTAIATGTTGDTAKDAAIDVGMQEQFARAFEAYLMEGKAPSADLRSAFEKFRAWLISVYKTLRGLDVKISDDIRRVMDRMIASDEEIVAAQNEVGGNGRLFSSADQMGLSEDEYSRFMKLREQAEEDSKARLLREIMEPVKREQEKAYKAEREAVRADVEREVNSYRHYRALEWMGNRRWLGDGQPEDLSDVRMSRAVLVERYGDGVLKTLPRGKYRVYANEGGLDPDDIAGWFGFDSGDEMIKALEAAPPRKDTIEAETDRIMRDRHGDPLNDGSLERKALDAVHTDKRGQWIAAELEAVRKIVGSGVKMTAKEARASARQTLAQMKVRDAMNANRFLSAERKAAEEAYQLAAKLSNDGYWETRAKFMKSAPDGTPVKGEKYNDAVSKLYRAKRRQLINHALYTEARKVAEEVEKGERFVSRLGKKTMRERIAGAGRRDNAQVDYLGAIDEILQRYDFRKGSRQTEARRGAVNAYVEAMKEAGRENEIAIPDAVLADAGRKSYKSVPVEELRGVIDSLKNLQHVALRWDKLIDAQQQRELEEVVSDIADAFDQNMPKRAPGRVGTTGEKLRNAGRQFLDLVLNASTLLREIDGLSDDGPAFKNLKAPIDAAMDRLTVRRQKAANDLDGLYSVYTKKERRQMAQREFMPELGFSLSKWEKLAIALNTGNEGNYSRLTDGKTRGALTEAQVASVLDSLDERDAKFVQSVWDYVNSFRPDIEAREKRATGVAPEWVEGRPVTIAGLDLKGGYYPLKYDPRLSSLARDDDMQDISKSLQAGRFGKAQTKNGHLKERAKSSGRDIELDMSVLHRHVNQVIYDLELSEPVANSWRILQNSRIRSAFMDAGREADFEALEIWLKDIAEGEVRSADLVSRASRSLKSNFTASKLAFNISTVAVQVTGLAQSMVVVGKKDFVRGLTASFRKGVPAEVAEKSPFMATRQTTFNKDIFDMFEDPKTGPIASRWTEGRNLIAGQLGFWLMTKVQWYLVDVPTWMAGYQQGLRKYKNDEAKAITHADNIVKRSQASGLFSDRSAVERGSVSSKARQNDVVRLFTALGSYMFAKFNVAYERTAQARGTVASEGVSLRSAREALSWTLDMAFLFSLEAVIIAAIKGRLPDGEDEDDEGWTKFLARETAFSAMGTVPFVRDIVSSLSGFEGGGAYGSITKDLAAPFIQAGQGEVDKAFVKSVVNATGIITGAPTTAGNRIIDAGWRQSEGEDVSPAEYLLGRIGR
jgi:hypothetical protein